MNGISYNLSILLFSLLKKMFKHQALIRSYLFLWGQPVHLGVAIEICWATQEIHIKLRVQCWGYQTSQPAAGTSPALLTGGWTVHSESDIFPPAHELWPDEGRREESSRNRERERDRQTERQTDRQGERGWDKSKTTKTWGNHRKQDWTFCTQKVRTYVCTAATYTMIYVYCQYTSTTWNKIYCRHVD